MPDLKQLLEPLERREMPDRWDAIRARPPHPLPDLDRSRLSAYVTAGAVAVLAVAIVVLLLPLRTGTVTSTAGNEQAPAWLVRKAYAQAYSNGDVVPDAAAWLHSDADTIAPAVGLEHGDPSAERYLIVLHGNFTAYGAKILAGDDIPRGHVMVASFDPASHGLLDFGVGNEDVDLAGLQPFTLPDPAQMFTAVDGWRVALPPGWHAQDEPFRSSNGQSRQVIISNLSHAAFTIAQEPMPVAAGPGVPRDAVVLIVTTASSAIAGFAPVSPPLSLGDFELSRGSDGSMIGMLLMQGSEEAYAVTIRVGYGASAVDSAALESVIETITFP